MRAPSSTAWPTKRLISQEEMWGNLSSLPVIALMSAITTVGWAEYNRLRFVNADKRRRPRTVAEPDVDQRLGATEQLGTLLRHSRISSVAMDKFARPVAVRVVRHR
ncbi:poly-beta-1,6-N-acetyl-D-glucosamine biosynthesis protein PgaD [Xanthomonas citri pv. citri]|nr:poly-beta-1,6-N-acetyl-D-glucosamine biosynthesis protein PgaD [Xanthomonas citri pv. citri]